MAREEMEDCEEVIALPNLDPNHQSRSLPELEADPQVRRENNNRTYNNGVNRPGPQFDPLRYLVPATEFVLVWFAVIVILGLIAQLAMAVLGIYLKYNPSFIYQ